MSRQLQQLVRQLQKELYQFTTNADVEKLKILQKKVALSASKYLLQYHDMLLYILAYPQNKKQIQFVTTELNRIALFIKSSTNKKYFTNTGLPFSSIVLRFSHDAVQWLLQQNDATISLHSFEENAIELNNILKFTLPSVEFELTNSGFSNDEILEVLGIDETKKLEFLTQQFQQLNTQPSIKDFLWESIKPFIHIQLQQKQFSKSFNFFQQKNIFYHNEILKNFDYKLLLSSALPTPISFSDSELQKLVTVIKKAMIVTLRETDTSTYIDEKTLRYYQLERGISIAIYGMKPNRQMALQSYIGYTLFKNGLPTAYGGSWIFGEAAMFGLNIFEPFRSGESGYLMCQLLRVYIQVFKLNYIEIEAYQFGKDNEDGIKSGAFWFYYKYGFRSLDKDLQNLAKTEYTKLKTIKDYRTSENKLKALAESNMFWQNKTSLVQTIQIITSKITSTIIKKFKGNRVLAESICSKEFRQKANIIEELTNDEKRSLSEIALLAEALKIKKSKQLQILKHAVFTKPICPYQYNDLLIQIFKTNNQQ